MLGHIKTNHVWLDRLIPDGLRIPSSTLISGPGGSGKPLISAMFLAAWLKKGGSAIALLINSDRAYLEQLLEMNGILSKNYSSRIFFVDFNPDLNTIINTNQNQVKCNILIPDHLSRCLYNATRWLGVAEQDIMLYGAALNILLFSPTWRDLILEKLKGILHQTKGYSPVFSVSTSAFKEEVKELEDISDNLIYTRFEEPFKLFLKVGRVAGATFDPIEIQVPLSQETLMGLKDESAKFRKQLIQTVSKI